MGHAMPGTFLTAKERERLASFPDAIPHWDLITSFTLTDEDHTFIQTYRNDPHRLGVALQLGAVRYLGFCPTHLQAAPLETIAFLAAQLHIDPTGVCSGYVYISCTAYTRLSRAPGYVE